jgi:hypothetical protein
MNFSGHGERTFNNLRTNFVVEILCKEFFNSHAWLHQVSVNSEHRGGMLAGYCSFAYSDLASFRMGMSGSASFHRVRKLGMHSSLWRCRLA